MNYNTGISDNNEEVFVIRIIRSFEKKSVLQHWFKAPAALQEDVFLQKNTCILGFSNARYITEGYVQSQFLILMVSWNQILLWLFMVYVLCNSFSIYLHIQWSLYTDWDHYPSTWFTVPTAHLIRIIGTILLDCYSLVYMATCIMLKILSWPYVEPFYCDAATGNRRDNNNPVGCQSVQILAFHNRSETLFSSNVVNENLQSTHVILISHMSPDWLNSQIGYWIRSWSVGSIYSLQFNVPVCNMSCVSSTCRLHKNTYSNNMKTCQRHRQGQSPKLRFW